MNRIHKEGYQLLLGLGITLVLFNGLAHYLLPNQSFLLGLLAFFSVVQFLFVLYFFRNPKFVADVSDNRYILAPADGKIVVIEEVEEPEYFKDKRLQVSIFMSPTNAHVNRSPIRGKVVYSKYHPGNYLVAWHPKSSTLNERFTTVIEDETEELEILVRQIAGKLARKISNYVEEGEQIMQGNEFGFIKFGSRVDLFLPLDAKVKVNLKGKVKAGKTILAELT